MPKIVFRKPITVVITLEGLAASAISCYGCSWNETPSIDSLAADGVVWDRWTSPIDRPGGLVRRWLDDARGVIRRHAGEGEAIFMTDDAELTQTEAVECFSKSVVLQPSLRNTPAESIEQTAFAQIVASAVEAIDNETRLIWLHSDLLCRHWDAPIPVDADQESAEDSRQEDSVDAESLPLESLLSESLRLPETTAPPSFALSDEDDPDLLFAWMSRYAAQVRVLDAMIGLLVDGLGRRESTLLFAGSSGFCLGENGWLGHHVGPLRSAEIRLPMIVSRGGPLRVPTLHPATELASLLERSADGEPFVTPSDWCAPVESFAPSIHTLSERADAAITTPTWFFVRDRVSSSTEQNGWGEEKLYLKPDDVHDINDVSRLRRDVVDHFQDA